MTNDQLEKGKYMDLQLKYLSKMETALKTQDPQKIGAVMDEIVRGATPTKPIALADDEQIKTLGECIHKVLENARKSAIELINTAKNEIQSDFDKL